MVSPAHEPLSNSLIINMRIFSRFMGAMRERSSGWSLLSPLPARASQGEDGSLMQPCRGARFRHHRIAPFIEQLMHAPEFAGKVNDLIWDPGNARFQNVLEREMCAKSG